jgi:predicted ATPase
LVCLPLGATGFPYAPLVEALRSAWSQAPDGADALVGGAAEVLSALSPRPRAESLTVPTLTMDGSWEQAQLFARIDALFGEIASSRAVVLAIEDLHWADEATVAWLTYLVRTGRQCRLLVLLTYRDDDLAVPTSVAGVHRGDLQVAHGPAPGA